MHKHAFLLCRSQLNLPHCFEQQRVGLTRPGFRAAIGACLGARLRSHRFADIGLVRRVWLELFSPHVSVTRFPLSAGHNHV